MKKIVFVTRRMVMGGIEKALLSMLETIPKEKYDVTVLVMGKGGELLKEIPSHIKVECLYGEENSTIEKVWNNTKNGRLIRAFKVGWYTILSKRANSVYDQEMYHSKMVPTKKDEYDLAVAYHVPASFPVVYVMKNLKAKYKVAWIHSDVSVYENALERYKDFYFKYNHVCCVSKYAMDNFVKMFPDLKDRTSTFYNLIDENKLRCLALKDGGFSDEFKGVKILTVGRLTSQKGQDIIPIIIKKLILQGHNIRWYLIGDGENRSKIEKLIEHYGIKEQLILLGTKENPYPYFNQCDLYVQPSRHEGYCITLAEARIFNKPIITTDFVGAREQIIDGETGYIVNFNEKDIFNKIDLLLKNVHLMEYIKENLNTNNFQNKSDINQLLNLV